MFSAERSLSARVHPISPAQTSCLSQGLSRHQRFVRMSASIALVAAAIATPPGQAVAQDRHGSEDNREDSFLQDYGRHESQDWPFWGGNLQNTHSNDAERELNPSTVEKLALKWVFTTAGDVSATPTVEGRSVYVPDWGGMIYRIDEETGRAVWSHKLSEYTGDATSKSRNSPAIAPDRIVFGDLAGGRVLAVDKSRGDLLWEATVDRSQGAEITGSPVILGDRVFVGVSSAQEGLATQPGFKLSFRGSIVCLDLYTGKILWQTYTVPEGYTGGAVWGSNFAVDAKRHSLYVTTGNNYSVPDAVTECLAKATDVTTKLSCLDPKDLLDAVLSLDLDTGKIKWSHRLEGADTWTVSCIANAPAGIPCPDQAGPDFDFGSGPNFYSYRERGHQIDVVGAGQKSGVYWALNADDGSVLWGTQVGPGGSLGGIEWGSATDGHQVYTALNDSNRFDYKLGPDNKRTWNAGSWAALDAVTGKITWQVPATGQNPLNPKQAAGAIGQVSVANGVFYAGSLSGDMVALDAKTGRQLWKFASGGSVISGPSIVDGTLFWGSGYSNIGVGTPNKRLYAFELPRSERHHDSY